MTLALGHSYDSREPWKSRRMQEMGLGVCAQQQQQEDRVSAGSSKVARNRRHQNLRFEEQKQRRTMANKVHRDGLTLASKLNQKQPERKGLGKGRRLRNATVYLEATSGPP